VPEKSKQLTMGVSGFDCYNKGLNRYYVKITGKVITPSFSTARAAA
jgi:hypothetical protein